MTPIDDRERARLDELHSYRILDTPREPSFDRVAQLAAQLCGRPMAVITLVDERRQWYKASVGCALVETHRSDGFCAHTIMAGEHFVVTDAERHAAFAGTSLVAGEPHIRSYHGVPLVTPRGHAIGALAVLGHEPGELDDGQRFALDVLAEQVVVQLEERHHRMTASGGPAQRSDLSAALTDTSDRFDELFLANPSPMWIYDVETLALLDVNDAMVQAYGYPRERLLTMSLEDIRPSEDVPALRGAVREFADRSAGTGMRSGGVWRHRLADGEIRDVEIVAHGLTYAGRRAELVLGRDVTHSELAARRASELSERLGATLEHIVDGVVLLDRDLKFIFANPSGAQLLERPVDVLVGRAVGEVFPELRGTPLAEHLERALAEGEAHELEMRWEAEHRAPRWGMVRIHPVDEGLMVFFTEITERHEAQARAGLLVDRLTAILDVWRQLSDAERDLDELYELIPQLVLDVLNAQGSVLYFAEPGDDGGWLLPRSRAGFSRGEIPLPIATSLAGRALTTGRPIRTDDIDSDPDAHQIPRPDGTRSLVIAPVHGADGPLGVIAVLDRRTHHFTEADVRSLELLAQALGAVIRRVTADEALRSSEERFRLVSRATTDAIYDWDVDADRVWWNDGLRDLFGWDPGELPSGLAAWTDLIHPDDRERCIAEVRQATTSGRGETWLGQYRFLRADGTYALVRDRMYFIRRPDGHVRRMVGGLTDVTAQVESEIRAMQSQRLEAVGQLTGGLAHDFNNLLTVILGNADQLVHELRDDPELRDFAEMTRTAAQRGAELSHRLLAFARRQPLEPRSTDVNELLGHLDGLLRRTLPEHIDLELVRGAGTWPAYADPAQLEAALLNLCLNARDSMPEGGRITIETGNARIGDEYAELHPGVSTGQYTLVAVTDTGTGMSADLLDRVFEPFFTTKEPDVGTGLGLSMVHGFVKQSAGHVTIYSEIGEGTTVRLYLPRSSEPSTSSGDEPTVRHDTSGAERILLVEDDVLVQRMAARHLSDLGYDVLTAGTGPEALDVLRASGPVDLLFTDVVMPGGMNGRELADAAVDVQPGLAVLFTSGYTENAIVHQGRLDPGVELLSKPYRLAELGRKVRAVLDRDR